MENEDVRDLIVAKCGEVRELDMDEYRCSFVSGEPHGSRIRVKYFYRESDRHFFGVLWFGPKAEGPPAHAHGGSICAVLDETMGAVAWLSGLKVVSAKLTVDFRKMIPLGKQLIAETWVDTVNNRKVNVTGKISDFRDNLYAEGQALFVTVPMPRVEPWCQILS